MTDKPMTLDEIADILGKPYIKVPEPITTEVRKVRICPCCGNCHPSDVNCKPLERLDYSGR